MVLQQSQFHATVPATDMERARRFYEDKVGLSPEAVYDVGVVYRCADGTALFLYPSSTAGAGHTAGSWFVDDLAAAVAELRGRGIEVEEYDFPNLKTINGIADLGDELAAWFKDSEGNILAVSHLKT